MAQGECLLFTLFWMSWWRPITIFGPKFCSGAPFGPKEVLEMHRAPVLDIKKILRDGPYKEDFRIIFCGVNGVLNGVKFLKYIFFTVKRDGQK